MIDYFKTYAQWGHTRGALAMMAIVSGIAYAVGVHPAYAVGYAFAVAWYYSRALEEHQSQDPQIGGLRDYIIVYWDRWRASKFVFAFIPATLAAFLCAVAT